MNFIKSRNRSRRSSKHFLQSSAKWRSNSKKTSRRNDSDDSESEERKSDDIKDWVEEFFGKKSMDKLDQDVDIHLSKKQTLILSTLVPNEILESDEFDGSNPRRFVGVLLMADVSGYTALSERYGATGKGGTYRLTVTLNTYLGSLIELIYSHGGDIIKFAGDAFLALWKTDKRTFLCHTIHTVIACALIIQHSYGSYETDVKVNLRVKLAISAGNLMFSPIGRGIDMNYIIIGLPVFEAKLAESYCASGEVKLAPTAWGHCYSRNYDYIIHENGHVTIKSILYDPHEKDVNKPFAGFGAMMRQIRKLPYGIEHIPDALLENLNSELGKNEALSLRTTVLTACERNIGTQIRKFMVRPVLTQIDAHQPLEYLTEMRQVSVLFITLKPIKCPFPQLITIVNNTYQITCEIVYKSMGCVNKIILFDKDVMILVIFGLRGFKHESEAQAALKCAFSIRKSVSALDGVLNVSIGVTTGQVYCGVVGHPLRREFTVIGSTVNKAARLMCYFQNKITCDEITLIKSKMSTNGFTLMERIELKGIKDAGKIYEYSEDLRVKELYNIKVIPPLLNRLDEMDYFESWISDHRKSYREFDAMLLIGESRIGKTKLLEWMSRHCKNQGFHVSQLNLTSIHSSTPYLALTQIVNQLLGLREPITGFVKEEKIMELMKVYNEDLCYLNDIIKARFAYYEGINAQDNTKRMEKAKIVFSKLLDSMGETYVIFLDDLQNLDSLSWEFISLFFASPKVFSVFSVTRGKFSSVHEWLYSVFVNDNIRKIVLGPLTATWIPPLACQILDVDAVPNDLCNALRTKCKGMPGLVESFILHLFSTGAVELKQIQDTQLEDWKHLELQFPDPALLHPQTLNKNDQPLLDELLEKDNEGVIGICIVHDKDELNTDINIQNTDALVMIQIDSLTPYQQLLLKIASVIGDVISRDLLESIMYENNYLTTARAIKRLFSLRILSCSNVKSKRNRRQAATSVTSALSNTTNLTCECGFEYDPEISEGLPKYAFCKVMKFRNKNVRKTCYELLPMNQKKEFHSRVIYYFENNKQKCSNCGGTLTIVDPISCDDADTSDAESILDFNDFTSSDDTSQSEISDENQSAHFVVRESLNLKERKHRSLSRFISDSSTSKLLGVTKVSGIIKNTLSHIPILKADKSEANMSEQRIGKRVTIPSVIFYQVMDTQDENYNELFDMLRPVTEARKISDWHKLGVIDSLDDIEQDSLKSINICLDENVSNTDFSKCSCAELNMEIYEQLVHHATRAELKKKTVEFLLHYSYLNYLSGNIENIYPSLESAELICLDKNNQEHFTAFEKRRFLGRIYSLQTAANLIAGKLSTAKLDIERACQYYGVNLHKMTDFFRILTNLSHKRKKYKADEEAMQADLVFMINIATLLFSSTGDEALSKATAYRALGMIKKVNCSVIVICDTLSNVIQVELDRGQPEAAVEVERIAKNLFANLPNPIEAEDLYALGKLYMTIFKVQLAKATLAPAIRTGLRVVVISRFLHADNVSLDIIPDLVYLLLSRRRIEEAVHVIRLLLTHDMSSHEFHNCETWYHALCLDLILDAGLQLESPQDISRFAEYSLDRGFSEGSGRRRLVVGLWTYWLRADFEKKAKRFEAEALSWTGYENDDGSMTSLISAMRLAEGMLECLARKVSDLRKVVDMMELRSIADRELLSFEKDIRVLRTLSPRWIHMRARSHKLSGRRSVSIAMFNQAKEEARRVHNHMEESLAIAATGSPVLWRQNARTGLFLNWRSGMENAQTSWHNMMYCLSTSTRTESN